MPLRVLVIDDERNIRLTLPALIQSYGHQAQAAASPAEAIAALQAHPFDLALLDLRLGKADGLDLLPRLLDERPGLPVVLMTAFATIPTAVDAIRRGARDYLPKPFDPEQIRLLLDEIQRDLSLRQRIRELEDQLSEVPEADFQTSSPAMATVLDLARRVAGASAPVLLRGENLPLRKSRTPPAGPSSRRGAACPSASRTCRPRAVCAASRAAGSSSRRAR